MKFFTSLLAGLASAVTLEGHALFEETEVLPAPVTLSKYFTNGKNICNANDGFTIFNLLKFQPNHTSGSTAPLMAQTKTTTNGNGDPVRDTFAFDLCHKVDSQSLSHSMEKVNTDWADSGSSKSVAVWADHNTVTYHFTEHPDFNGITNKTDGAPVDQNIGFTLNWTSVEKCGEGNFTVTLNAYCEHDTNFTTTSKLTSQGCQATWNLHSHEACGTTLPIAAAIRFITPFLGAILIVVGLIMVVRGPRFIRFIAAFIVGLFVSGLVFGALYSFIPTGTHTAVLVIVLLVAIGAGGLAAKLGWEFVKTFMIPIMAAAGSVAGILLLAGALHVDNKYTKIGLIFVAIILGGFLGHKFNNPVKTFGTAFVGAFMTVRGLSTIFGGWPGDSDVHHLHPTKKIWAYLGTFVVLFVGGVFVQSKYLKEDSEEDEAFADQDEGKKCGCL